MVAPSSSGVAVIRLTCVVPGCTYTGALVVADGRVSLPDGWTVDRHRRHHCPRHPMPLPEHHPAEVER